MRKDGKPWRANSATTNTGSRVKGREVRWQQDLTLLSASTAVAATLNVVGPGLGQVGATENFEAVNSFGRVVLTGCMLLGRLEMFTALALLSPAFWRR